MEKKTGKKILVLCTGNSCRSQMAHGFLQHFDSTMVVRSAGTKPAEHVNAMAVKVMAEAGVDISAHTPHDVSEYTDEAWDYVITVCGNARECCPVFRGAVGKQMHIGFDDPSEFTGTDEQVAEEFRRVRDEIRKAMARFYIVEVKGLRMPQCCCHND